MSDVIVPAGKGRKLFVQSQLDGRHIEVVAVGDGDCAAGTINKWLEDHPGHGVVDQWGALVLIARMDDMGVQPLPDERRELYKSVLTNWYEMGQYWSQGVGAIRDPDSGDVVECHVIETEQGENKRHHITLETVALGFARILNKQVKADGVIKAIAQAWAMNEGGITDVYDDDAIIQAGLFGELVYG